DEEHVRALELAASRREAESAHAIEAVKLEWEDRLEKARREGVRAMESAAEDYEAKLSALRLAQRDGLAAKESEQQAALRRLADEHEVQRGQWQKQEQELRRRHEAQIAELQASHVEVRKQATANQLSAVKAIEEARSEREEAIAAAKAGAEKSMARLREEL